MTSAEEPSAGSAPDNPTAGPAPDEEPVWTYRGYELRSSDFTAAMVHLFRAEISRANAWRQRLDSTTNWAVLTTGASISFLFTEALAHHSVIFLNALLVTLFLFIEARRYRYYELWSSRVRLMETDFFATMLVPPFRPSPDWAESLAANLLHPQFTISLGEALGRRLRHNYVWIYFVLMGGWMLKVWLHPVPSSGFDEFLTRASLGSVPGSLVLAAALGTLATVVVFGLVTIPLRQASGEVVPRFGGDAPVVGRGEGGRRREDRAGAWFRPSRRRRQFLAVIVTDHAPEVSAALLENTQRGVTALDGTGMYTGRARSVLICALTVTEIPAVRALVRKVDPDAFVVVTPAHEVYGEGFAPLGTVR